MREVIIKKTLYTFDELTEEAKQQAIETKRQAIAEDYPYSDENIIELLEFENNEYTANGVEW